MKLRSLRAKILAGVLAIGAALGVVPPSADEVRPFEIQHRADFAHVCAKATRALPYNVGAPPDADGACMPVTGAEIESFRYFGVIDKALHLPSDSGSDRCGISYLWALRADHPFNLCCQAHDTEYEFVNARPRLAVDLNFYACCVEAAANDLKLRGEALLFYKTVRVFGSLYYEGPR